MPDEAIWTAVPGGSVVLPQGTPAAGVPLFVIGHSYDVQPPFNATATTNAALITRLTQAFNFTVTNASQTGYTMADIAERVIGTAQPLPTPFRGVAFIDCLVNDFANGAGNGTAKALSAIKNNLTALIASAQGGSRLEETNAAFVFTGAGWAAASNANLSGGTMKQTYTQGDSVTITLPSAAAGLNYTLLLIGTDDTGLGSKDMGSANITYTLDAVAQPVISTSNAMLKTGSAGAALGIGFVPITIPANGSARTVVLTKGDATGGAGVAGSTRLMVDALVVPQAPASCPPVLVASMVPYVNAIYAGNGGAGAMAVVNGAAQTIAAAYPKCTYVDMTAGWNAATMCNSVDGLHPNDLGHANRFTNLEPIIAALAASAGMNIL